VPEPQWRHTPNNKDKANNCFYLDLMPASRVDYPYRRRCAGRTVLTRKTDRSFEHLELPATPYKEVGRA